MADTEQIMPEQVDEISKHEEPINDDQQHEKVEESKLTSSKKSNSSRKVS